MTLKYSSLTHKLKYRQDSDISSYLIKNNGATLRKAATLATILFLGVTFTLRVKLALTENFKK